MAPSRFRATQQLCLRNSRVQEQQKCAQARQVSQQGSVHVLLHRLFWCSWRNLCALEWAVLNPKGTSDEFGTYYNGLSAEAKQVSILDYFNDTSLPFFDCFRSGKNYQSKQRSRGRLRASGSWPGGGNHKYFSVHFYAFRVYYVTHFEFDTNISHFG